MFLLVGQFSSGLPEPALRVVTEERDVDLDSAVKALALRSLLELRARDSAWPTYDMPAMAREFARKLMAGHTLNTEVALAAAFLRRFPGLSRVPLERQPQQCLGMFGTSEWTKTTSTASSRR